MLKVSDNFKKSCNSDNLKYREFIIIDNKEIDIKGNLSATAYKDTTFFGKFNLKMLTFETENDIDYKGKEFVYYKEVDGESAKIGTFIVTEVKDSDTFESVNVTAYDYGLNFANPYKSTLDYKSNKITMFQVAEEICTNCGVELENTSLPNGNFIVDSNQFINDEQFGDVICLIALENGMFATINENDKLEFIFKKTTEGMVARLSTEDSKNLLTEDDNFIVVSNMDIIDDYVDLDDKRDTKPITCVLVATSKDLEEAGAIRKDQELIKKYGENWLKVYDYAFAYSSEKCEKLVDAIFNQVKGFGYSSFETNYSFKPYLQLGDEIKFRNKKGDLVKSIILRIESNYDEIKLSAPSIINASVEYDLPQSTEELVKGAMISVNRANAEVVLKVNSAGNIAQVRLDGDSDDGSLVNIKADNIKLEGYTTINDGFSVDEQGNATMNNGTMKNAEITGGNIELIDDGSSSTHSLMIYNEDSVEITTKNITESYNNDLSNNVLKFSFPDNDLSLGFGILEQTILKTDNNYSIYSIAQDEYVNGVIIGTSYVIQDSKNVIFYKVVKDIDDNLITTINRKEYRLPNNIGKVNKIGDIRVTDYINYEEKKVKYSTNVNSNGLRIYKDTIDTSYAGDGISISNPNGSSYFKSDAINWQSPNGSNFSNFIVNNDALIYTLYEHGLNFTITNAGSENQLSFTGKIICNSLEQTSLESAKKNFEKFNGALEEIKNIDIYKYNLKNEKNDSKKHLGFVIGKDFNYSEVVTSNDNKGVDNYSFTSLCLQAIKEQQEKIELLEKQLNDIINIIKESE